MPADETIRTLESITDANWNEFVTSPLAVLVLTKKDCPACRGWLMDLKSFVAHDRDWKHVRLGKVVLDGGDVEEFKRQNDWLERVEFIPFSAIFVQGEPRTSMTGAGIDRLKRELETVTSLDLDGTASS